MRKKRWENVPRLLRRDVIDGIEIDGVDVAKLGGDVVEYAEALTGVATFLRRCEAANIVRVAAFVDRTDPYDVVWGIR